MADHELSYEGEAPKRTGKGGYKDPPVAHQFKPKNKMGKGRPKGAKSTATIVRSALTRKKKAQIGPKVQKLNSVEISLEHITRRADKGDAKANDKVIELYERYGPQEDPDGPEPEETQSDIDTLRAYLAVYELFEENRPPQRGAAPDNPNEDEGWDA